MQWVLLSPSTAERPTAAHGWGRTSRPPLMTPRGVGGAAGHRDNWHRQLHLSLTSSITRCRATGSGVTPAGCSPHSPLLTANGGSWDCPQHSGQHPAWGHPIPYPTHRIPHSHSLDIPTSKHFCRRQYWQRLRVTLLMMQFLSRWHVYTMFFWMLRRKKPWGHPESSGQCWHSTAQHGTARHGTGWHPAAQHGTAWHPTAWHGTPQQGTARPGSSHLAALAGADPIVVPRGFVLADEARLVDARQWRRGGRAGHDLL